MALNIRAYAFPFLFLTMSVISIDGAEARASRSPKKNAIVSGTPQMSSTDPKDFAKTGAMSDAAAAKAAPKYNEAEVKEGPRLKDYATTMKTSFPTAKEFKELPLLPLAYGGTSFTGLIGRLLGEGAHRDHEGLKTRRFIYHANLNGQPVGVAHGSSIEARGKLIDVFVFYTPGGTIKQLKIENIPESTLKELTDGGFLEQFVGRSTHEFEVVRGKRGKIRSKGVFFSSTKSPGITKFDARSYYDKIVRAVRYNAAFMDVAYFITQHPDLADKPVQEFPEEVEVTSGTATAGPEAYIRSKKISGSPIDGKMTMQSEEADEPENESDEEETSSTSER